MATDRYTNTRTNRVSGKAETEVVSLSGTSAGSGGTVSCAGCVIWTTDSNVFFTIDPDASATADSNDLPLLTNQYLPIPIDNTDKLRFYNGGGSTEKVYILTRQ